MLTFWLIALLCALVILRSKIMTALKEVSGGLTPHLPAAALGARGLCGSPGCRGSQEWAAHGRGFFLGDFPTSSSLCSRTFFPHSPTCLCSFKEPMCCSRGRSRGLVHPTLWASVSSEQCAVSPRCLQSGREPSGEQCLQSGCSPRGPWAVPVLLWCHEPLVWLRNGSPWLPGAAPGSLKSAVSDPTLFPPSLSESDTGARQREEKKRSIY